MNMDRGLILYKKVEIKDERGFVDYGVVLSLPFMRDLVKTDKKNIKVELLRCIVLLNSKLNVKNKMSEDQMMFFVDDLVEESLSKSWRVEELVYFFSECGKSRYGKIYERLDQVLLFEFLGGWEKERFEAIREYNIDKKKRERVEAEMKREVEWKEYLANRTGEDVERCDKMVGETLKKLEELNKQKKVNYSSVVVGSVKKEIEG